MSNNLQNVNIAQPSFNTVGTQSAGTSTLPPVNTNIMQTPQSYHPQTVLQGVGKLHNQQIAGALHSNAVINNNNIISLLKKHMYLIIGIVLLAVTGYYYYTKKYCKNKQTTNLPIGHNSLDPNSLSHIHNSNPAQQYPLNYENQNEQQNEIQNPLECNDKDELDENLTNEEMEAIQRQLQLSQN